MDSRPVATTLLTALLLWSLWLWRRHRLLGVSAPPGTLAAPGFDPGHVPVLPPFPGTPGAPPYPSGGLLG